MDVRCCRIARDIVGQFKFFFFRFKCRAKLSPLYF